MYEKRSNKKCPKRTRTYFIINFSIHIRDFSFMVCTTMGLTLTNIIH
nr:MAG TPA: hypothetical protein [Caudoviricetes sp.]